MLIRALLFFTILLTSVSTLHAAKSVSIGAILPLSGKFAAFGNKALQGIELAVGEYNATYIGTKRPVRLLIKDSKDFPEAAEKAVIDLDREGVNVIIGPILAATAESAAKKAQELWVPIITMTQKEEIAGIGEWVFRNCITNAAQVRGLVDHAVKGGIKTAAVLYPDNPYGREMARLFTNELSENGGKVVASQSYKDEQTDFGTEIKTLAGPEFLKKVKVYMGKKEREFREAEKSGTGARKARRVEIERPMPEFEAIFIPDYAARAGLIIPQLAFYEVKGVKLMGLNGWNSPKLIEMAGNFLDDTLFVDGFFSGSLRPQVKDFVATYMKTFGEEPGILGAQAYDTTEIILSVITENNNSRDGIRDKINKIRDYQGVTGNITFKERDGERSLYYLTVSKGAIMEAIGP